MFNKVIFGNFKVAITKLDTIIRKLPDSKSMFRKILADVIGNTFVNNITL